MSDVAVTDEPTAASRVAPVSPVRPLPSRGRRVRRVLRRVDPVSVLKFSLVFYLCIFVVLLVAGVALWGIASATGVIGNIEEFIADLFALDDFRFEAAQILQAAAVGGVLLVLLGSFVNVLASVLYNLISDLVGGIELTLLEEEPGSRPVV